MIQEDGYLLDPTNKILLKKLKQDTTPAGCGKSIVWSTEYDNLFLSPDLQPWPDMTSDVDITDFIKARDDYIMWQMEKKLSAQDKNFRQQICEKDTHHPTVNDIIHIQGNNFFKKNGDVIEHIECSSRSGQISEDEILCYNDVPIQMPTTTGFVQPSYQLFVAKLAP